MQVKKWTDGERDSRMNKGKLSYGQRRTGWSDRNCGMESNWRDGGRVERNEGMEKSFGGGGGLGE